MQTMTLDDLNKLRDLVEVIFRDVETEDEAYGLVDSEVFQAALKSTLDAWTWDDESIIIINEMREARQKFERDSQIYHIILLDTIIDQVKERINAAHESISPRTTKDGEIDTSSDDS